MKPVRLHPLAAAELRGSADYYAEQGGPKLASDFESTVRRSLMIIAGDPERFPVLPEYPKVRKCLLKRFPYKILYLNLPEHIFVVAIMNARRRPGYWSSRL